MLYCFNIFDKQLQANDIWIMSILSPKIDDVSLKQ